MVIVCIQPPVRPDVTPRSDTEVDMGEADWEDKEEDKEEWWTGHVSAMLASWQWLKLVPLLNWLKLDTTRTIFHLLV